jgi:hypothetical protein
MKNKKLKIKYKKYTSKNKNLSHILILVLISISTASSESVADVKGDADSLATQAMYIFNKFTQASVELRLGYEYRQDFSSDSQREKLHELAQKTGTELDDVLESQKKIKNRIESYNGDDWDRKYGDTGMWRVVCSDIYKSTLLRCRLSYYEAIASGHVERARICESVIEQLSVVPESVHVMLIKADVYALLGRTDESSGKLAGELYRTILKKQDVACAMRYSAQIGLAKLNHPQSPRVLDELAADLEHSTCRGDFELAMTLGFLQRRLGSTAILEKTVSRWPQTREFFGGLVLSDLTAKSTPPFNLSMFEADCAAASVLKDTPAEYVDLLNSLCERPDLGTLRVLYAAAVANSPKSPSKAVELFMKASAARLEPNDNAVPPPAELAKRGAYIALNLFKNEPNRCELVKRAVENYFALAGGAIDEQIEYSYSEVLSYCGDSTAAAKLLQKIAVKPNTPFGQRAKIELITMSCRKLLDANTPEAAKKVLAVLDEQPVIGQAAIFKYQAHLRLGNLSEAAKALLSIDANFCDYQQNALGLLSRYADRIDEYADSNSTIDTFYKLGRCTLDCADEHNRPYAATLYVPAAIFAARGQKEKLDAVEVILNSLDKTFGQNNIDLLTLRARLSAARGDYEEAANRWRVICEMLKTQPAEPPQHSRQWWQAKYFELEYSAKMPGVLRRDTAHAIEVLENSFNEIPQFWDEKLKKLKESN